MARGPEPGPARGVPPGRLVLLLLLLNTGHLSGVSSAQELNGFSLHPPYFNLAEGTRITASATCGEDGARSVTDLYCKLVGGPVSGDPSQTIQVLHRPKGAGTNMGGAGTQLRSRRGSIQWGGGVQTCTCGSGLYVFRVYTGLGSLRLGFTLV